MVYKGRMLAGALTIIFIVLKLFSIINWAWWLVISPVWIYIIIIISLILSFKGDDK